MQPGSHNSTEGSKVFDAHKPLAETVVDRRSNFRATQDFRKFQDRLGQLTTENSFAEAFDAISKIGRAAENVLYARGVLNLWLPPIDSSIQEYTPGDFIVTNPLNNRRYSLIQSPQIMKEIAALFVGPNWRRTTCYRAEPGDATHAQLFQQIDVEMTNVSGAVVRSIATDMYLAAASAVGRNDVAPPREHDYSSLRLLYGEESPNLISRVYLDKSGDFFIVRVPNDILGALGESRFLEEFPGLRIIDSASLKKPVLHGEISEHEVCVMAPNIDVARHARTSIERFVRVADLIPVDAIDSYWITNMPMAKKENGKLVPVHHVMALPYAAERDPNFTLVGKSEAEILDLMCDGYDFIVSSRDRSVEVAGGGTRIHTARLQREALQLFERPFEKFDYLLEALRRNELRDKPVTLCGFAFGLERLGLMFGGFPGLEHLQMFPTNSADGSFVHTSGWKE